MCLLTSLFASSAATRMAFLIARSEERPWLMMLMPLMPMSGRAAVFGVIDAAFERPEGRPHHEIAELPDQVVADVLADHEPDGFGNGFGDLEHDVADETVADDDVCLAGHHVAALDVADEIERRFGQELERLLRQFVPLGRFFTDGKQAHAGVRVLQEVLRVDLAHDGELQEMVRFAVHIRADIQNDAGALHGRHERGDRRPLDPLKLAEHEERGGHGRAGVPRADHGDRFTALDEFIGHTDRRIFFPAEDRGGRIEHVHDLGGIPYLERKRFCMGVFVELCLNVPARCPPG